MLGTMGTCQFYKVMMYDRRQALTPGIHFFLKIGKFRISDFHVFATGVCEISLIHLLWRDQLMFGIGYFRLYVRHEKLLLLCNTGHTHGPLKGHCHALWQLYKS